MKLCRTSATLSVAAVFLSAVMVCPAQQVEQFRAMSNIVPQAESYQMAVSGNLMPSQYTGAMSMSLPLYEYKDPDFDIPVSLEYSYDGYHVSRSAGTVGLGWSLNCGGVITREVRGLKDEYESDPDSEGGCRYGYWHVYRDRVGIGNEFTKSRNDTPDLPVLPAGASLARHLTADLYEDVPVAYSGKDSYDISPDVFHFRFGAYSGDFMMNGDGSLTVTSPTHPYGDFSITVGRAPGNDGTSLKFTIRTGDGYEYTFGDGMSSREYAESVIIADECMDESRVEGQLSGWTDTAWRLTKITAPNGRTATFSYLGTPTMSPSVTYSYSTYTCIVSSPSMPQRDSVPSWQRTVLSYAYSHPLQGVRVQDAQGRDCATLDFGWEKRTGPESELSGVNYENGDLVSSRFVGAPKNFAEVKLRSLAVIDESHHAAAMYTLEHGGLSATGASRMVLRSVSSARDGIWRFEYDGGPGGLPPYDSKSHDIWGYWNQSIFDPRYFSLVNTNTPPAFRPDLERQRAGALTRVYYPTGGHTDITYGLHRVERALVLGEENPPHMEKVYMPVGGIRVESLSDYTLDEEPATVRRYEYSDGETTAFRYVSRNVTYVKHWGAMRLCQTRLMSTFYSNDLASMSSYDVNVGYGTVRETWPDGSSVVRKYMTNGDYGDVYLTSWPEWLDASSAAGYAVTDVEDLYGGSRAIPSLASPQQSYSDFRGKMKSETEVDASGRTVKTTEYSYTPRQGIEEFRHFNMLTGWVSHIQTRFYPLLYEVKTTRHEPGSGMAFGLETETRYTYDGGGRRTAESYSAGDRTREVLYTYCLSNPSAGDACAEKAALSDVEERVRESALVSPVTTGRWHFGYSPLMRGVHPVKMTEYIYDIPRHGCSRTEETSVTYDVGHRPVRIDMPGGSYVEYGWDGTGTRVVSRTVDGPENRSEYRWRNLVGLESVKHPTGQEESYTYDSGYRLRDVKDSDGNAVRTYTTELMSQSGNPYSRITVTSWLDAGRTARVNDVQYYDGLGRPDQSRSEAVSGDGGTVVTPVVHDAMGRADVRVPLPYASGEGAFAPERDAESRQRAWYRSTYGDGHPHSERTYESGRGGRPLSEMKPGDEYRRDGRRIHWSYSFNEPSDSVFTFGYTAPEGLDGTSVMVCTGRASAGTLSRVTHVTEDGDTLQTFTDVWGRLVLERRVDGGVRHDTYRIYDIRDSVVFAVQPEGSAKLKERMTVTSGGAFAREHCFMWTYDGKGNLVAGSVPGGGIGRTVYDARNRAVFSTDTELESAGRWRYTLYDRYDRVREEGTCRLDVQTDIRSYMYGTTDAEAIMTDRKVHRSVEYWTSKTSAAEFVEEPDIAEKSDLHTGRCLMQPYHERLYPVGVSDGGPLLVLDRYHFYGRDGRAIEAVEQASSGEHGLYAVRYDFTGNVVRSLEGHSTRGESAVLYKSYTYDSRGRMTGMKVSVGGLETSTSCSYDALGRPSEKVHGGSLRETMAHDIRGWLDGHAVMLGADTVFSESLKRMAGGSPQYSGRVSGVLFTYGHSRVSEEYGYDRLGRLRSYGDVLAEGLPDTGGLMDHDLNGNVLKTVRGFGDQMRATEYTYSGNRLEEVFCRDAMQGMSFSYDGNGRLVSEYRRNLYSGYETTVSYNELGLPEEVRRNDTTLTNCAYLPDGMRYDALHPDGSGISYRGTFTFWNLGAIEKRLEGMSYEDGRIVPVRENGEIVGFEDRKFVKDRLGSVRAVVGIPMTGGTAPGARDVSLLEETMYTPYGEVYRDSSMPVLSDSRWRYAGKEEQGFAGLEHLDFGARLYHPEVGRWTSPDPLAAKYLSVSPYVYCNGDPVNVTDPDGNAWKPLYYCGRPCGFQWVPDEESYDYAGNLLKGLYHQAIFFSDNGTYDSKDSKNISSSTAYVYKEDGTVIQYDACTMPSSQERYPTIPEGAYEAKVGIHGGKHRYEALRMSDIGTGNFYANRIELGYENPAYDDGRTYASGINIHKAGKDNLTGLLHNKSGGVSEGCLLIDTNNWASFISNFNTGTQRNNVVGIIVSRSLAFPVKYLMPPPISESIHRLWK